MPGLENSNTDYEPDEKICLICKKVIDCKAKPKIYTYDTFKRPIHYHCLMSTALTEAMRRR